MAVVLVEGIIVVVVVVVVAVVVVVVVVVIVSLHLLPSYETHHMGDERHRTAQLHGACPFPGILRQSTTQIIAQAVCLSVLLCFGVFSVGPNRNPTGRAVKWPMVPRRHFGAAPVGFNTQQSRN